MSQKFFKDIFLLATAKVSMIEIVVITALSPLRIVAYM